MINGDDDGDITSDTNRHNNKKVSAFKQIVERSYADVTYAPADVMCTCENTKWLLRTQKSLMSKKRLSHSLKLSSKTPGDQIQAILMPTFSVDALQGLANLCAISCLRCCWEEQAWWCRP